MDEKEKYYTELEARFLKLGATLHEIKTLGEQSKKNQPELDLGSIVQKHEDAKSKLKELRHSKGDSWLKFKAELNDLADDIDDDLRQALAYFG